MTEAWGIITQVLSITDRWPTSLYCSATICKQKCSRYLLSFSCAISVIRHPQNFPLEFKWGNDSSKTKWYFKEIFSFISFFRFDSWIYCRNKIEKQINKLIIEPPNWIMTIRAQIEYNKKKTKRGKFFPVSDYD